jgi:hypothetical protein
MTTTTLTHNEILQCAADTHKNSSGETQVVEVGNDLHFDPETAGGLLCIDGIYASLRAPKWRDKEGDPVVHASDIMLIPGLTHAYGVKTNVARIAHEVEGFAVRMLVPGYKGENTQLKLMGVESVDVSDPADTHPELYAACREVATEPQSDAYLAGLDLLHAVRELSQAMEQKGAALYPGANLAYRPLTPEDMNQNAYIQRVVRLLGGAENYTYLDRASIQQHIERTGTLADSAFAFNVLSHYVMPVMSAISFASPFARGELTPVYPKRESIHHDLGYLATGYFGRTTGSPEAGPAVLIAPTKIHEMQLLIDQRLRSDVPTAGRTLGHHTDRLRVDLSPLGSIELCADDNFGLHIETIMSASLVKRAISFALESAHQKGTIAELAARYPLVVRTTFSEIDTSISYANSEKINQFGLKDTVTTADGREFPITITAANGQEVAAREVFNEILLLAQNEVQNTPYEVPKEALEWVARRAQTPNSHDMRKDAHGLISASGYYRGGNGTLSHYMQARVKQLTALKIGFTPQEAISNAMADATRAHMAYLRRFTPRKQRHGKSEYPKQLDFLKQRH